LTNYTQFIDRAYLKVSIGRKEGNAPNIKPIQPKLHLEVLTAEQRAEIKSATPF